MHPTVCLLSTDPPVNLIKVISTSNSFFFFWPMTLIHDSPSVFPTADFSQCFPRLC